MRLRRGLKSELLPCGCFLGVYEDYDDAVVRVIDAVGETCTEEGHTLGAVVPGEAASDHTSEEPE